MAARVGPTGTALLVELTAAANHRAALQAEVAKLAHDVRKMQMDTLATLLDDYGIDPEEFPPALVAAAMQGLALVVVEDQVAGSTPRTTRQRPRWTRLVARLEERRSRSHALTARPS